MKIAIAGDYYVNESNPVPEISSNLIHIFKSCDLAFVNFEGPVFSGIETRPEFKTGPNICQNPDSISYLKACGINGIAVANNHFYDFGKAGVEATISLATEAGLDVFGIREGGKIKHQLIEKDDIKVAVLAYAEEEWCGPRDADISVALLDVIDVSRDIDLFIGIADAVIVVLHGNNEYNNLPSPTIQKQARFFIECGAGAVFVHHSHVISGVELWNGKPIVYGLANFQFNRPSSHSGWYEGLVAVLEVEKNDRQRGVKISLEIIPTCVDKKTHKVDVADGVQKEAILSEVSALSICLESSSAVEANFQDFCSQNHGLYARILNPLNGAGRIMRHMGSLWVKWVLLRRRRSAAILNAFRCQSHRNAITVVIAHSEIQIQTE